MKHVSSGQNVTNTSEKRILELNVVRQRNDQVNDVNRVTNFP